MNDWITENYVEHDTIIAYILELLFHLIYYRRDQVL